MKMMIRGTKLSMDGERGGEDRFGKGIDYD